MHVKNNLPLINDSSKMSDALLEMTKKGFGITGVVSNSGNLTGVISDGDLRRNMNGLLNKSVVSVMTKSPIILDSSTTVSDALTLMNDSKITSVFISTSKKSKIPKGIVHVHDCLRLGTR